MPTWAAERARVPFICRPGLRERSVPAVLPLLFTLIYIVELKESCEVKN